jgi:hypothetical protein
MAYSGSALRNHLGETASTIAIIPPKAETIAAIAQRVPPICRSDAFPSSGSDSVSRDTGARRIATPSGRDAPEHVVVQPQLVARGLTGPSPTLARR